MNFFDNILNSLSGGVTSVLGNLISSGFNALSAKKQYQREQELMKLQQDYNQQNMLKTAQINRDEWDRQFGITADYNSPKAQMERLKEAGLNPLQSGDAAGFVNASPGGSVSNPSVGLGHVPAVPPVDLMSGVSNLTDSVTKQKEAAVHESETQAKIKTLLSEAKKLDSEANLTDEEIKLIPERKKKLSAEIEGIYKSIENESEKTNILWNEMMTKRFLARLQERDQRMRYALESRGLDIEDQKSSTLYNQSVADVMNAQTDRQKLSFEVEKFRNQHNLAVARFNHLIDTDKMNDFRDLIKGCYEIASTGFSVSAGGGKNRSESSGDISTNSASTSSSNGRNKSGSSSSSVSQVLKLANSLGFNIKGDGEYKSSSQTLDPDIALNILDAAYQSLNVKYKYFVEKNPVKSIECLDLLNEIEGLRTSIVTTRRSHQSFYEALDLPELREP